MAKSVVELQRRTEGERIAYGDGYRAGLVQAKSICEPEGAMDAARTIGERIKQFDALNWPVDGMLTP